MTAPLGSVGSYTRPPLSVPSSTAPVPALARNAAHAVPGASVSMMAAAPLVRVTADHLALIRGLILAGQTSRAMEMLDAVWHPTSPEEQCWYLRLWVLAVEGRVVEALDLARLASQELPGSVAIACVQAALEHANGDAKAALELAHRAMALAPDEPVPAEFASRIAADVVGDAEAGPDGLPLGVPAGKAPDAGVPTPPMALQLGASLLFPLGSPRPLLPPTRRISREVTAPAPFGELRRLGLIAAATVVAALWAIRDPVPAFLALAAIVVLLIRNQRR